LSGRNAGSLCQLLDCGFGKDAFMDIADIGVTPDIRYLLLGLIACGWKSLLLTFGGIAIARLPPDLFRNPHFAKGTKGGFFLCQNNLRRIVKLALDYNCCGTILPDQFFRFRLAWRLSVSFCRRNSRIPMCL
jgi:hypothetical protein